MFWPFPHMSTSPVDKILDKKSYTLKELLEEDRTIEECKALNGRLLNVLRERAMVEKLIRFIVVESPEDAEQKLTFKIPAIACEILSCEVDIILTTLVEDEKLMNLLFSFLEPKPFHSTLLAGYFSKVVICLLRMKTYPFMLYVKGHQKILNQLVELIGMTPIMEVLLWLTGAHENKCMSYSESMQWIEDTDVLEMIMDKFSSSDSPEVHVNAAETLSAVTRFSPLGVATKISSPNFIGRLLGNALEDSRPESVLVNSLSVCISLLDPKRHTSGTYHAHNHQITERTMVANPETVTRMLGSLGGLLKLLDVSHGDSVLVTTYGLLQPPLGKHRLKIVEFISVLLEVGSEASEKELMRTGAFQKTLGLFFQYPYNNFLHHHVANIILSCLERENASLIEHLLGECNLIGRILEAENNSELTIDPTKTTSASVGRKAPRVGNIGHLTHMSNKLLQLPNSNSEIQAYLQGDSDWMDWHTNVLAIRNSVENVYQWACGRPEALHDRKKDDGDVDDKSSPYLGSNGESGSPDIIPNWFSLKEGRGTDEHPAASASQNIEDLFDKLDIVSSPKPQANSECTTMNESSSDYSKTTTAYQTNEPPEQDDWREPPEWYRETKIQSSNWDDDDFDDESAEDADCSLHDHQERGKERRLCFGWSVFCFNRCLPFTIFDWFGFKENIKHW